MLPQVHIKRNWAARDVLAASYSPHVGCTCTARLLAATRRPRVHPVGSAAVTDVRVRIAAPFRPHPSFDVGVECEAEDLPLLADLERVNLAGGDEAEHRGSADAQQICCLLDRIDKLSRLPGRPF